MNFQVCSWGGYTFIINLIPMHALLCIVTGRYSSRLYIAYAPLVSVYITARSCFTESVNEHWEVLGLENMREKPQRVNLSF